MVYRDESSQILDIARTGVTSRQESPGKTCNAPFAVPIYVRTRLYIMLGEHVQVVHSHWDTCVFARELSPQGLPRN